MKSNQTEAEFVKLLNHHQGLIHKVCLIYERNDENRKDLFQDIVLQLWRAYPSFKGEAKISTWMYRIALNTAISTLRKVGRNIHTTDLGALETQIADINETQGKQEKLSDLENAITHLSDIDRAIVMLYFEDTPYEEIAETLGITQNNVRVKMNRIREKLRTMLTAS